MAVKHFGIELNIMIIQKFDAIFYVRTSWANAAKFLFLK